MLSSLEVPVPFVPRSADRCLIKRDAATRPTLVSHIFSKPKGQERSRPRLILIQSAAPSSFLLSDFSSIQRVTSTGNYLPSLRWSGEQALFDQG